jgi:hypothetical protein
MARFHTADQSVSEQGMKIFFKLKILSNYQPQYALVG